MDRHIDRQVGDSDLRLHCSFVFGVRSAGVLVVLVYCVVVGGGLVSGSISD
ncbi:hypothetical protein BDV30DRAFT_218395, partial [Aspergillus minisclerotigenes]